MLQGTVEVLTWKTQTAGGNGLLEQLRAKFMGGNIGHAALRLTLPVDTQTTHLLESNCFHEDKMIIPFKQITAQNGQKLYEVYISAWPDKTDPLTFNRTFRQDSVEERNGVHFNWDPKWTAQLQIQPEKVRYKGKIGKIKVLHASESILHLRELSEENKEKAQNLLKIRASHQEVTAFNLLIKKLNFASKYFKGKHKLSGSSKILLDRFVPDWKTSIRNTNKVSLAEIKVLQEKVQAAKALYFEYNHGLIAEMRNQLETLISDIKNNLHSDLASLQRISPTLAKKIETLKNLALVSESARRSDLDFMNLVNYDASQIGYLQQFLSTIVLTDESIVKYYSAQSLESIDESHLTLGIAPDHLVSMPLEGFDLEKMLKKAKSVITSGTEFSANTTNCSMVAGGVLAAGAKNNKAKAIFNNKAFGVIATPQMAFNNARSYMRSKSKKQTSKSKPISEENPSTLPKNINITGFTEINLDGLDKNLTPVAKAEIILNKFEESLNKPGEIPYFAVGVQKALQAVAESDTELLARYVALCNSALAKANQQSKPQAKPPTASATPNQESKETTLKKTLAMLVDNLVILNDELRKTKGELSHEFAIHFKVNPEHLDSIKIILHDPTTSVESKMVLMRNVLSTAEYEDILKTDVVLYTEMLRNIEGMKAFIQDFEIKINAVKSQIEVLEHQTHPSGSQSPVTRGEKKSLPILPNALPILPNPLPILPNALPILPNALPITPKALPITPGNASEQKTGTSPMTSAGEPLTTAPDLRKRELSFSNRRLPPLPQPSAAPMLNAIPLTENEKKAVDAVRSPFKKGNN